MFSLSARTVYNLAKRFGIKPKRKSFTNFGKSYRRRAATIPVGTITYHKAGEKRKAFIITEEGRVPLHIHNWRRAGGEIPEGYVLKFIDGNPENCEASNLKLMTRGDIIRGWKKPAKNKAIVARKRRVRVVAPPKEIKPAVAPLRVCRKEVRYPDREQDLSKKVAVRIDHRTIVFINPGEDREKVLARYKKVG
jgi:hypothetical protein